MKQFLEGREITTKALPGKTPAVSIVMPTYRRNKEGLLTKCIQSVLAQTFQQFEFIIVDDGSSDGTETVVRDFAQSDARIVYVRHSQNCGLPAVRTNEGILLARAALVAFIFDDNIWCADALTAMVHAATANDVDVVHGNIEFPQLDGGRILFGRWPLTVEILQHLNTIPNGGVLCKKEFFNEYGMYDPHIILRRCCDWDLWLRALRMGARFKHVDHLIGREYGLMSPTSIGRTVEWDYKVAYSYMASEGGLSARIAGLRPSTIPDMDVFDPEAVMPHVRSMEEWDRVEHIVYKPFFDAHPEYERTSAVHHNRRHDPLYAGCVLNARYDVLARRRRALIVSNRFTRIASELCGALSATGEWIALSCMESQLSAFSPLDTDLVILCDCCSPSLVPQLNVLRQHGVPVMYAVVHGTGDDSPDEREDPLFALNLAKNEAVQSVFQSQYYFPSPGNPWTEDQRRGAEDLLALCDTLLDFTDPSAVVELRCGNYVRVEFVPNRVDGNRDLARARWCLYMGDPRRLPPAEIDAVAQLAGSELLGDECCAYVTPGSAWPDRLQAAMGKLKSSETSETLPSLVTMLKACYVVVPASIIRRHSTFERSLIAEDLARNGGRLLVLQDIAASADVAALHAHTEVDMAHIGECHTHFLHDSRAVHIANLVTACLLRKKLSSIGMSLDRRVKADAPGMLVLLNSPLLAGSEVYGLQLSAALARLGFSVEVAIPSIHSYGRQHTGDELNDWMKEHGLSNVAVAPYGLGSSCFLVPDQQALEAATVLGQWLDTKNAALILCSGFIPEPLIAPSPARMVFVALMQPWGYYLDRMTFMRTRAHGLLSDSRWSALHWAELLATPIAWVPSIVEHDRFRDPNPLPSAGTVMIAIAGTIQPRKRQLEALEVVKRMLQEGYDVKVNLYGYELELMQDYVGSVKSFAKRPPLTGLVAFHQLVDFREIVADNHILLSASVDESMPQSLLLAMAGGLIPVASPAGGVSEVVVDGVTGYLANGFTVDHLTEALRRCLDEVSRWGGMAQAGHDLLVRDYTEEVVAKKVLRLILRGVEFACSPGMTLFASAPETIGGHLAATGEPRETQDHGLLQGRAADGFLLPTVIGPRLSRSHLRYSLVSGSDRLCGFRFMAGTFHTVPEGTMRIELSVKGSRIPLRRCEVGVRSLRDNSWSTVAFEPIANSCEAAMDIRIVAELEGGCVALYEHPRGRYIGGGWSIQRLTRVVRNRLHWPSVRPYFAFHPLFEEPR